MLNKQIRKEFDKASLLGFIPEVEFQLEFADFGLTRLEMRYRFNKMMREDIKKEFERLEKRFVRTLDFKMDWSSIKEDPEKVHLFIEYCRSRPSFEEFQARVCEHNQLAVKTAAENFFKNHPDWEFEVLGKSKESVCKLLQDLILKKEGISDLDVIFEASAKKKKGRTVLREKVPQPKDFPKYQKASKAVSKSRQIKEKNDDSQIRFFGPGTRARRAAHGFAIVFCG